MNSKIHISIYLGKGVNNLDDVAAAILRVKSTLDPNSLQIGQVRSIHNAEGNVVGTLSVRNG